MADEKKWEIHVPEVVGKVGDKTVEILHQLLSVFRHMLPLAVGVAALTVAGLCFVTFPPQTTTPLGLPSWTFGIAVVVAVSALWLSACVWWVLTGVWRWRARWHLHQYLTNDAANLVINCLVEGWVRVDSTNGARYALELDRILFRVGEGETHEGKRLSLDYVLTPWARRYLHNRRRLEAIFPGMPPGLISWVLRDRTAVAPVPKPQPQAP
jgi:hypothetical protein